MILGRYEIRLGPLVTTVFDSETNDPIEMNVTSKDQAEKERRKN